MAKDLGSRLAALETAVSSRMATLNGRLVAAERAYHALDANHVRLVGHLDIYAGQLAANEAKMTERLGAMEAAHSRELQAQDVALQAKLGTVETLFVACDAALKGLQQDLCASASATPGSEQPVTAILRKRLDEVAADLLTVHAEAVNVNTKIQSVEDQVVSTNVSLQNGVTELMSMLLQATGPLNDAVRDAAGREQMLMCQLHEMWQRMEAGACRCPVGCPGPHCTVPGAGAPTTQGSREQASQPPPEVRAPPGWRAEGHAVHVNGGDSGNRRPFLDQFFPGDSHRGGGGPGGPGGGGSGGPGGPGGGGPGGPDEGRNGVESYDLDSQREKDNSDGPKHILTKYSKTPFESKAATTDLPQYNGREKSAWWRKKVTAYLHSRNPDMKDVLRWAELQKDPITKESLRAAKTSHPLLVNLRDDPEILGFHLWGFLNVNLVSDAWEIFDGVDAENGLEVWRVLNLNTTQKTSAELHRLEDAVIRVNRLGSIRDIPRGLIEWDASYREYIEAGGQALSEHRKVWILMSLFPKEITEKVSWELDKFEGQPLALRNLVREKTQCLQWDGSTAKGKAHLLEGGGEDGEASDELDSLRDQGLSEDMPDGELAAFVRKRLFNKDKRFPQGAGRPRQAPARDRAPARSKEDMTCPNCLEKGHSSQECTKPKIDVKDRRCFLCKEK